MAPSKLSNDARKKLAANLQVLRRYDDQIDAIVDTTSHVVLYQFEESTQSWANKEVEGALFVYKRSSAPYYGFTILNRVGLENYTELLSADMSFQASDQIAIYTSKNGGGIVGIWIYEETDRVRIPEQLSMCCSSARSAVVGQGPRCLYPKNAEEEREFLRMYPRSRSNSRRDGANEAAGANSALSTIVNRTRQQQKKQPHQPHSASKGGSANPNDLVSKLQAIGLDPSGGAGGQPQDVGANASALPLDPAIIMARKSVKPSETSPTAAGSMAASFQTQAQDQKQTQVQNQAYATGGADEASAFRSPLPVPVPAVHGQGTNGTSRANGPPSPVLHPAPSPFPPSTIATPLPGQALQGISPNAAYMAQMQQFWHPQMGNAPVPRSAHASPAPMAYAMHPAMHVFPQLVMGHPGAPHTPQPHMQNMQNMQMGPLQLMPGMSMLPPQQQQQQPADSPEPVGTSVAQNLAEQLVSLVRQRMTSVHPASESSAAPTAEPVPVAQQAALPPSALKMQRDYCREWLIRVIRADDELVDAFAQRFPPPIFAQQNQ